jgi:hypothetical protein
VNTFSSPEQRFRRHSVGRDIESSCVSLDFALQRITEMEQRGGVRLIDATGPSDRRLTPYKHSPVPNTFSIAISNKESYLLSMTAPISLITRYFVVAFVGVSLTFLGVAVKGRLYPDGAKCNDCGNSCTQNTDLARRTQIAGGVATAGRTGLEQVKLAALTPDDV